VASQCKQCNPCPEHVGNLKGKCVVCKSCTHGVLKANCETCSNCGHSRLKHNCAEPTCRGCPEHPGNVKSKCKECAKDKKASGKKRKASGGA